MSLALNAKDGFLDMVPTLRKKFELPYMYLSPRETTVTIQRAMLTLRPSFNQRSSLACWLTSHRATCALRRSPEIRVFGRRSSELPEEIGKTNLTTLVGRFGRAEYFVA